MFVTLPQFEVAGLSALAAAGQRHWRAVMAEFPVLPWYLFVYQGQVLDRRVSLTLLVAWEESLVGLIDHVATQERVALYRVDPHRGGLTFRTVQTVWAPAEEDGPGLGAILAFEGDGTPLDPWLHPVPPDRERRLVFEARTCSGSHAHTTGGEA